ncbi:MAG: hypothetical protein HKN36_00710 [Hellea sp.]|nr:hypothetical protein [Hellea sp.]
MRIDHAPMDKMKKRWESADKSRMIPVTEFGEGAIAFDERWPVFAAYTAKALKHRIIYNSDGGYYARGLVRLSGDLHRIYTDNMARHPNERWSQIGMKVLILRFPSGNPRDRLAVVIRFKESETYSFGSEKIVPEEGLQKSLEKKRTSIFLLKAMTIAMAMENAGGGKKWANITELLQFAIVVGYPKNMKMWIYNPKALAAYHEISEAERKKFQKHLGYFFHFKGEFNVRGKVPIKWQLFPIADLNRLARESEIIIKRRLSEYYDGGLEAINNIVKLKRAHSSGAGGFPVSKRVQEFWREFAKIQKTSNTNYGEISVQHLFDII